jgi:hypothetical protein
MHGSEFKFMHNRARYTPKTRGIQSIILDQLKAVRSRHLFGHLMTPYVKLDISSTLGNTRLYDDDLHNQRHSCPIRISDVVVVQTGSKRKKLITLKTETKRSNNL